MKMDARHCWTYEYPCRSLEDVQNFFARPRLGRLRGSSPTPAREIVYGRSGAWPRPRPSRLIPQKAGRTGLALKRWTGKGGKVGPRNTREDGQGLVRAVRKRPPVRYVLCFCAQRKTQKRSASLPSSSAAAAETLPSGTANPVMYDRPQWWPETSRPPTRGSRLTGRRTGRQG